MTRIPKDGTFVVLSPQQISNFDLLCAAKSNYPHTEIIAQQPMPRYSPQGVHPHLTVQRPPGVTSHDLAAS